MLVPPVFQSTTNRTVAIQLEASGYLVLENLVGVVHLRDCTQCRLVSGTV